MMHKEKGYITLHFDGREVKRWKMESESFRLARLVKQEWLADFAASMHCKVIQEWLCPVLRLEKKPLTASGIEVWLTTEAGTEIGVSVGKQGKLLLLVSDPAAPCDLTTTMCSGQHLKMYLRLREETSDTWGGVLHAAIKSNEKWRATRWDYVSKRLTREIVTRWADTKRVTSDTDNCEMCVALLQDVITFLDNYPGPHSKEDFVPWKRLVTEIIGRDIELLLTFCPRKVELLSDVVRSDSLDLFAPCETEKVQSLKAVLVMCTDVLRKNRLTSVVLFKNITTGSVAFTAGSVLKLTDHNPVLNDFYVGMREKGKLMQLAANTQVEIVKSFTRRAVINGKHTLLEKVILDRTITLRFIDQDVIDSFPKEVSGFKCQSDGHVLTHAIALLMQAQQSGQSDCEVKQLQRKINIFSHETRVGFPIIDNKLRRSRRVFFSDYNKRFFFRSDKSCSVPDECVPIAYTREMHENVQLDIFMKEK